MGKSERKDPRVVDLSRLTEKIETTGDVKPVEEETADTIVGQISIVIPVSDGTFWQNLTVLLEPAQYPSLAHMDRIYEQLNSQMQHIPALKGYRVPTLEEYLEMREKVELLKRNEL